MAKYTQDQLIGPDGLILARLPNNNAGLISAEDVRSSVVDTVDSIIPIVSSGDFVSYPFIKDVRLLHNTETDTGGMLFVGSGVTFSDGTEQNTAFTGLENIDHNAINNLDVGDVHLQYLPVNGTRLMDNDLGLDDNWINCSGNKYTFNKGYHGLKFVQTSALTTNMQVGSGTIVQFDKDKSRMSSAKGVAKAWINFDASTGSVVVNDAYNVSGISRSETGKFTITFNSGVFSNNSYVAIGHSNARNQATAGTDFSENTVAMAYRIGDDGTALRSITFHVIDDGNNYVDAKINDFVAFGTGPNEDSQASSVTVS
jgi:hypothetical protein